MRLLRAILIVTALGAAGGALVGFVAMLVLMAVRLDTLTMRDTASLLAVAAGIGAGFGLTLGPMLGFGLLRHVPLWKAVVGTAIGALLGVAASFLFNVPLFVAPIVGMVVAAIVLRVAGKPAAAAAPRDPVG